MKTYYVTSSDEKEHREIKVNDDEMIVYDVCKIKDYEGGDYVPRKARQMDHHLLPIGIGGSPDDCDS